MELYDAGQTKAELAKAYDLHPTTVSNWIKFHKNSGSFHSKGNLTDEQKRIKELENKLKDKQMEINVIKKQWC